MMFLWLLMKKQFGLVRSILVGVMEDVCWYRLYLCQVTAGTVMKVYFEQKDQTWAQAQFNYGDWSGIAFSLFDTTMVPTVIYGWSFESRVMELTLTQEILDNIQAKQGDCEDQTNVGIIIQGSDLTFTKITIVN